MAISQRDSTKYCGVVIAALILAVGPLGCAPKPDRRVEIVAFGDSTTDGPADETYPECLATIIDADPGRVSNQGRRGETAHQGLRRLRRLLESKQFPNTRTLFFWEGGNDLIRFAISVDPFLQHSPIAPDYPHKPALTERLDRIQKDISAAIRAAQSAGLTVYVATYFHVRRSDNCPVAPFGRLTTKQAARSNEYIDLLNARIRSSAMECAAAVVDIAALAADIPNDEANFYDCDHLSNKGNARVAEVFKALLR